MVMVDHTVTRTVIDGLGLILKLRLIPIYKFQSYCYFQNRTPAQHDLISVLVNVHRHRQYRHTLVSLHLYITESEQLSSSEDLFPHLNLRNR